MVEDRPAGILVEGKLIALLIPYDIEDPVLDRVPVAVKIFPAVPAVIQLDLTDDFFFHAFPLIFFSSCS